MQNGRGLATLQEMSKCRRAPIRPPWLSSPALPDFVVQQPPGMKIWTPLHGKTKALNCCQNKKASLAGRELVEYG